MSKIKKRQSNTEVHLFIIWENARNIENKILEDINVNFKVLKTYEVHWTQTKFSENLSRFYGTQLPPNSKKETHVGSQPFLAVIVEDKSPVYKIHVTSKGDKKVNSNLFTAKARHRDWTGGGHRIHATNTVEETNHDLTLLFGKNTEDLLKDIKNKPNPRIEKWEKDVIGANGWDNLRQLFYVFNNTIKYVVLRNFEPLPDSFYAKDHGDIDLLVPNFKDACLIANARPVYKSTSRVYSTVCIGAEEIYFDFRHLGDGYYDIRWQEAILNNRILTDKSFYIPREIDYFYSLLYHALIHKPAIGKDYIEKLIKLSPSLNIKLNYNSFKTNDALNFLSDFLLKHNYSYTQPTDKSVYFHQEHIASGVARGVKFSKKNRVPLRNHLKKKKALLKHYAVKIKRTARGYAKRLAK